MHRNEVNLLHSLTMTYKGLILLQETYLSTDISTVSGLCILSQFATDFIAKLLRACSEHSK